MAAKKEIDLETNWVRIVIGYNTMILPWDDGIALFKNLSEVMFIDRDYSENTWKIEKQKEITMHVFTPKEQAALLMSPEVKP